MASSAERNDLADFNEALQAASFSTEMSAEQVQTLTATLCQWSRAFAYGDRQLGECLLKPMVIEADIPTPMPTRLRLAPYPASPKTKQDISDSIDELLKLGVIRESLSEFAAPVVMVYKGGKPRFCVNYKALNDYTRAFVYPLPRINETLGMITDSGFISSLDMNRGFHQCWVDEASIKYTAFASHRGLYEYVRMPFGLKNAPAHFQQAMDTILGDLLREGWVKVYIDDVLVFSKTFEDHVKHLGRVLEAISKAGFTISIKKCHFAHRELRALGRKISGMDLAVDPHKIAAVRDWPAPRNLKEFQSFLGFINYHRAHLKDLAKITRPMTSLLSKDVVWEWTEQRQKSFQAAKDALLDPTVLAMPDWSQPFKLYIDASFEGLGAELMQSQQGKERPVAFISRRLKPAEERYGATQLECLGLIWALEKLYYYLDGANFEVYTDCLAIKTLLSVKNPNRHMLRWQLAIQEHRGHMTVVHRPGTENRNADALSRNALPNDSSNPASDLEEDTPIIYSIAIVEMGDEWFTQIQTGLAEDIQLSRIATAIAKMTPEAKAAAEVGLPADVLKDFQSGKFFLLDGTLYRREGLSSALVLGDVNSKQAMLRASHDAITAGHFGYDRTLATVRTYAWWPKMASDVKKYIETCDACLKSKRGTGKQPGLLMKIETPTRPWEVIHMDFVSALPMGGAEDFNTCLVIADRATKKAKFIPTHDKATAKDIAHLYWSKVYADYGLPSSIISDRDPKFTSGFWKHLFRLLGVKLRMSTAHHPQTDGLAERTIQTLVDLIRRYCAFGLYFQDGDGYRHDWVSLLPGLEQAYNISKHSVTGKTPFELERGWHPRTPLAIMQGGAGNLPVDHSAQHFAEMIDKARTHAAELVDAAFEATKKRFDDRHVETKITEGCSVLISTKHFGVVGSRKLKDAWIGPFIVSKMINDNAARLLLTPPYDRKHDVFPVSLLQLVEVAVPGTVADRPQPIRKAPLRMDEDGEPLWEVEKILDERKHEGLHQYQVKWLDYPDTTWEPAENLKNMTAMIRAFRASRRADAI